MKKASQKFFGFLFVAFLVYALGFSPKGSDPVFGQLIQGIFKGNYGELDPSIISVFWVMGLVPFFLGLYLIPVRHNYKLILWPFWVGAFALGAGALLPYLALRKPKFGELGNRIGQGSRLEKWLGNKYVKAVCVILIFGLVFFGFLKGSPEAYRQAFQTSRLVNVMSFDFIILMFIVWPYLTWQELAKNKVF